MVLSLLRFTGEQMEAFNYQNEGTILIVDDESSILEILSEMLSIKQYTVLTAETAEKALSIMVDQQVDIVITDEKMPGMSGNDLLRIIRLNYPDTIPMMITGYADTQTIIRAINVGQVYKFFTKPIRMTDLISSVGNALEHQRCIKEINRLRRKVSDQRDYITKLEKLYPGITQLEKSPSGAKLIDDE
jgi:DNA-binding NtrC family response regulator